jgi:predicted ferric reductase
MKILHRTVTILFILSSVLGSYIAAAALSKHVLGQDMRQHINYVFGLLIVASILPIVFYFLTRFVFKKYRERKSVQLIMLFVFLLVVISSIKEIANALNSNPARQFEVSAFQVLGTLIGASIIPGAFYLIRYFIGRIIKKKTAELNLIVAGPKPYASESIHGTKFDL